MGNDKQSASSITGHTLILSSVLTAASLLTYRLYRRIQPIHSPHLIPKHYYKKPSIYGKVTSVGDGDNFHLYHTPLGVMSGWGWMRNVPRTNQRGLKGKTLPVRLYGVDAPERSHFGRPAQPYSEEALQWLRDRILGKFVRVTPFRVDQYGRVVGKVQVYDWIFLKRDVSLEMVKYGVGVVYEGKSTGEFDGKFDKFKKLEAYAKRNNKGLWAKRFKTKGKVITPGEYKNSYRVFNKTNKKS